MSEEKTDQKIEVIPEVKPEKLIFKSKLPDAVKEYNRQYYLKTRAEKLEKDKLKVYCHACNLNIRRPGFLRHTKTANHIKMSNVGVKSDSN